MNGFSYPNFICVTHFTEWVQFIVRCFVAVQIVGCTSQKTETQWTVLTADVTDTDPMKYFSLDW